MKQSIKNETKSYLMNIPYMYFAVNVCGFPYVTMHALDPLKKDTNLSRVVHDYISLFYECFYDTMISESYILTCVCKMLIKIQKYIWIFVELSSASCDTERSKRLALYCFAQVAQY